MYYVFNSNTTPVTINSQDVVRPVSSLSVNSVGSSILPDVQENVANGVYKDDADHGSYIRDLLNQYALDFWLLGVMIVVAANLIGYVRFLNYLRRTNMPAKDEQNELLNSLMNRRHKVRLVRNPFVTTPMLIGILRPCIIIPDTDFDGEQLKNILLHEISHLRRLDIAVKWLTMVAAAIHWFNPLMYLIKKEINHACELACDEAVIKNLTLAEKQVYGDTLISVAAEHKYPIGVMQVTMSEEKKSLKERLLAIMNHHKKSRFILAISTLLLVATVIGAVILGASVRTISDGPPGIYINAEDVKTKVALLTAYDLTSIANYRTPYVGNNSKVLMITSQLPVPDGYFKQQFISLETKAKPYGLTVYYEAASNDQYSGEWPIDITRSPMKTVLDKNALVLFCMIDNLDQVTFDFRNSQSDGKLDTSKYNSSFTFLRASLAKKYGDLSVLGKNLDSLQKVLAEELTVAPKSIDEAVSQAVRSQQKSYLAGETATEGHIILDTEEKDGIVKAYTLSSFGAFGFENGIFTKLSGSGAIPTVMTFSKDNDGIYSLLEYKEPMDGAYSLESTKKMFPSKLWNEVLKTDKYPDLIKQQEEQAAKYLQLIGREAQVSANYVERKLVNIDVEASNKLFSEFTKSNGFLNSCPYWLGTKERIENGVRYIYETSQSKTSDSYDLIIFRKKKVDGSLVKESKYEIIGNEPKEVQ